MVSIYQVMYFCCLASLAVHCPLVLSRCYGHHPAQGGTPDFNWQVWNFGFQVFWGGRKIWQVLFFWGHLINWRIVVPLCPDHVGSANKLQPNLFCSCFNIWQITLHPFHKTGYWALLWSWDVLGVLLGALGILSCSEFCPHEIIPVTWNLKYLPPFPSSGVLVYRNKSIFLHWELKSLFVHNVQILRNYFWLFCP